MKNLVLMLSRLFYFCIGLYAVHITGNLSSAHNRPMGPMVQCNIVKTQVSPLCVAMQCDSLPGSPGLSVLNPGSP